MSQQSNANKYLLSQEDSLKVIDWLHSEEIQGKLDDEATFAIVFQRSPTQVTVRAFVDSAQGFFESEVLATYPRV